MAAKASPRSLKKKSKNMVADTLAVEPLVALPWESSLPSDDSFTLFAGTNELEGGFLSLEEIDESEYGLEIAKPPKSKKRKRTNGPDDSSDEMEAGTEENKGKKKLKTKKKRKKAKKKRENGEAVAEVDMSNISCVTSEQEVNDGKDDDERDSVIDEDFSAWNELRLHPKLMESIYRLGFKSPTPIQKACIPVAAHQGKDVIGAAETGSGKTLAFGLPILQRLLEEQEKAARLILEEGNAEKKIARGGPLRALVVTPTRELALQVTDHLKEVAKATNFRVVPIVGGMSAEKQERLLRARPEVVVGTPGRLWELMSGGDRHLVELDALSFFVLDEADRMIENGHFRELHNIIDMLPMIISSTEDHSQTSENCITISNGRRKKRQTFVFSATIALSADFRKKLKRGSTKSMNKGMNSIETLSERAGMRADVAVVDLTNASIMVEKLEESFMECREEDKDAYLYYILSIHGKGRTIVFCTSISALRHISSLLRVLGINLWTLHAQMQQRARLKAIDRFRGNDHGVLVATDVAARGLDIPGVRTVVHYQLPHSAEVYIHRSGRTARAASDGCSIALISPNDRSKFASLCKSFSKESLQRFPLDSSYMPEVVKRLSLARQIDKILHKDSQEKLTKNWLERNAESVELVLEDNDSEEDRLNTCKKKKVSSIRLKKLKQELDMLLSRPLQPKTFSQRFLAGSGVSPLLQHQFESLARQKPGDNRSFEQTKKGKLLVIGQHYVEPLQALRSAGHEVCMNVKEMAEKQRKIDNLRRKRKEEKKHLRDQRRKERKRLKNKSE